MIRAAVAVIAALLFYTLEDILLWQRIFESNDLARYAPLYHPGWSVMLIGELILGALLLAPKWREVLFYVLGLSALALCGLEDVLYYWMDGRTIPFWLPWLNANPMILFKPVTSSRLLLSVSFWLGLWLIGFVFGCWHESMERRGLPVLRRRIRVVPRPNYSKRALPVAVTQIERQEEEPPLSLG